MFILYIAEVYLKVNYLYYFEMEEAYDWMSIQRYCFGNKLYGLSFIGSASHDLCGVKRMDSLPLSY